jgi:hypothetical protein
MVAITDRAVTYSGDACKELFFDVLIRYKITEHTGVYDWAEYEQSGTTIAQLKTAVQLQIDALELLIEERMDVDIT